MGSGYVFFAVIQNFMLQKTDIGNKSTILVNDLIVKVVKGAHHPKICKEITVKSV